MDLTDGNRNNGNVVSPLLLLQTFSNDSNIFNRFKSTIALPVEIRNGM